MPQINMYMYMYVRCTLTQVYAKCLMRGTCMAGCVIIKNFICFLNIKKLIESPGQYLLCLVFFFFFFF